jgi:hypothetical protein
VYLTRCSRWRNCAESLLRASRDGRRAASWLRGDPAPVDPARGSSFLELQLQVLQRQMAAAAASAWWPTFPKRGGQHEPPPPVRFPCSTLGWDPSARPAPVDLLDVKYDGVTLRRLLELDEADRREVIVRRVGLEAMCTPAQRAAVSAHWSAELRAKVAAAARPKDASRLAPARGTGSGAEDRGADRRYSVWYSRRNHLSF